MASFSTQTAIDINLALERHFTPEELAELWSLSIDTVCRIFEREPDVLIHESPSKRGRRYRTMRIPESVATRVHRKKRNPLVQ